MESANLGDELLALVDELEPRLVEWRRDFHAHPELAYQEYRTGAAVTAVLRDLGLEVRGAAGTGVIGVLRGGRPGPTIALRADMDALPVQEEGDKPVLSRVPGVAHTCGHDAHLAIALGAASLLARLREALAGTVLFIFEPGEESLDSGLEPGAERLLAEEVLADPRPDAVLGLHVYPEYPAGQVALRPGVMMTGFDLFQLTVLGATAHTATAQKGADAIVATAHVITALQTLASREVDPLEAVIVHVGTIQGGQRANILADRVELSGSVRVSDQALRPSLPERLERLVGGVAAALRCRHDLRYQPYLPPVVNDPTLTQLVAEVARDLLGPEQVVILPLPRLTGESFHAYSRVAPAVFWFLGVGNAEQGLTWASHHPRFDLGGYPAAATAHRRVVPRLLPRSASGVLVPRRRQRGAGPHLGLASSALRPRRAGAPRRTDSHGRLGAPPAGRAPAGAAAGAAAATGYCGGASSATARGGGG